MTYGIYYYKLSLGVSPTQLPVITIPPFRHETLRVTFKDVVGLPLSPETLRRHNTGDSVLCLSVMEAEACSYSFVRTVAVRPSGTSYSYGKERSMVKGLWDTLSQNHGTIQFD